MIFIGNRLTKQNVCPSLGRYFCLYVSKWCHVLWVVVVLKGKGLVLEPLKWKHIDSVCIRVNRGKKSWKCTLSALKSNFPRHLKRESNNRRSRVEKSKPTQKSSIFKMHLTALVRLKMDQRNEAKVLTTKYIYFPSFWSDTDVVL